MLAKPYIGITGVTSADDVAICRSCALLRPPTHRLMAGVLVSAKTMRGDPTESRRYPPFADAEPILSALTAAGCWPVVHYNTSANGDLFAREIDGLTHSLPSMRGLQMNVVAPDPQTVRDFTRVHPDVEVILQVNGSSLSTVKHKGAKRGHPYDYIERYYGVQHALLDLSSGTGKLFEPYDMANRILECWSLMGEQGVRLGAAGGLGPDSAEMLRDLGDHMNGSEGDPDFELAWLSFDSETRIRVPVADPIVGAKHQDRLDRDKAIAWVYGAAKLIGG